MHVVVNSYHPEQELIELICVNYDITALKETELKLIEVQLGKDIDVSDKQKYALEY